MGFYTDVANYLKKWEGYAEKAQWDVNAWRIGHGSDTITFPNGTYRKVLKTDVTTREMAGKDLERRIKQDFEPKVKKQIGEQYYNKLPDSAKIALISLSYNYGSITKPQIIQAARSGDAKKLADAIVEATKNDNLGTRYYKGLRKRRQDEANYILANLKKITKESINVVKNNPVSTVFITTAIVFGLYVLITQTRI
jgi:GH24 family phage-related lysozyme (muramidase)